MKSIKDAPINPGTKVFVRCDLDVPIKDGEILEKYRLDSTIETLRFIIQKGGLPIIAGHIGKPEGVFDEKLSTKPLLQYFDRNLGEGKFQLLENLRFDPREEKNDIGFAHDLASRADIYVNECFSTSHREHTSFISLPSILPHYAGFRLQKEIETLTKLTSNPERPFISIVGGAKLESKLPVISKLLQISDSVLLGGKLAASWKETVPQTLHLAQDYIDEKDIGPLTINKFQTILAEAKTILWAGPMGMYEEEKYFAGTKEIAQTIARLTKENGITSVVGGGDTIAASEKAGVLGDFSFVSTGGGAMLEFIVKGTLPGIEALA